MNNNERRFSIIMTAYDQAFELKENLPAFLTQQYEPGYEVIVIDESSTDETSDVLKLFKKNYSNLYTTFLPKSEGHKLSKKQAFNIGVKAAKNDWIIFTNINNKLVAEDILQAISNTMDASADLTLGYLNRKGIKLQAFANYHEAEDHIVRIERLLQKVRIRKRRNFRWGRYSFIIVRKDVAINILKYYELRPSFVERQMIRWRIFWKNFASHYERITYLPKES